MNIRVGLRFIIMIALFSALVGGVSSGFLLYSSKSLLSASGEEIPINPPFHLTNENLDLEKSYEEIKKKSENLGLKLQDIEKEQNRQKSILTGPEFVKLGLNDKFNVKFEQVFQSLAKLEKIQHKLGEYASSLAIESAKIDALVSGSAAVSTPTSANKGKPFRALLRIKRSTLGSLLEDIKNDAPENTTPVGKADVKLTPRMTATLVGHGFEITPKDGVSQAVSYTDETTWEWTVTPTDSGLLSLRFVLAGTLFVEGSEIPRQFYAYTQNVNVSVGFMGFF